MGSASGAVVVAIDAGTTGVRSVAIDERCNEVAFSYRRFTQHLPRPGWVEHDANEIWDATVATLGEVCSRLAELRRPVAAVAITNQRETTLAWNRRTGEPAHRAIVWQDTRTADRCAQLTADGHTELVRRRTGLVIDPYFSATKMAWLTEHAQLPAGSDLAFGTIDSWLIYKLTRSATGSTTGDAAGLHVTDVTNACRTLLFDIGMRGGIGPDVGSGDTGSASELGGWDDELCDLFDVNRAALPEVRPTCGRFGLTADSTPLGAGVPISGVAGDQQAALFGQACFEPGSVKATYGTGSFVLMTLGSEPPTEPPDGLLVTRAAARQSSFALEGAVFSTGSAIDWFVSELGVVPSATELGPLAETVPDSAGLAFVPAFEGLGSPWWDPNARGVLVGLTRGATRAHVARAVVESVALSVRDVTDAMAAAAGQPLTVLRADGGVANMDLLLALQADQCRVTVQRPRSAQATALGSAMLAGLAEGLWADEGELADAWQLDTEFHPQPTNFAAADTLHERWLSAVAVARRS